MGVVCILGDGTFPERRLDKTLTSCKCCQWDNSLFSDINVSQGSVATLVRCGGIFNANFIANFLTSERIMKIGRHNDEVIVKVKMCAFFETQCSRERLSVG